MRRILIDLTDIELWSGQHGGTQRVVYGIAKNYYLNKTTLKDDVQFIAFSASNQQFYFTNFKPIYDRVEAAKHEQAHVIEQGLSRKQNIKRLIRDNVPELIRKSERIRSMAFRAAPIALRTAQRAKTMLESRHQGKIVVNGESVQFTQNDIVLMLGKPWDDLNIQKVLTQQKAINHFKLVQVVYDLIIPLYPHLHHPTLFKQYTQHMFEAVDASDLMLSISKSSASDLQIFCNKLNLAMPRTEVIRLGDDITEVATETQRKPDDRINDKFLACIGTIEIRKNHTLLYYAYKLAQQKGIDLPQLVIIGRRGWLTDDFQYLVANDPFIKNKILILDNLSDAGLDWVYKNCQFTVYPSMYEGWGLPISEALSYGKICVSSGTSSMMEIAGDLVDYFSPYDAAEFVSKISIYLDDVTRTTKETEIKKKYKTTTWESTYKDVQQSLVNLK